MQTSILIIDCKIEFCFNSDALINYLQSMDRLLSRVGHISSPGELDQECSTFIQRMENMKERQKEITSEEIQVVMEQRDMAVAKVNYAI